MMVQVQKGPESHRVNFDIVPTGEKGRTLREENGRYYDMIGPKEVIPERKSRSNLKEGDGSKNSNFKESHTRDPEKRWKRGIH